MKRRELILGGAGLLLPMVSSAQVLDLNVFTTSERILQVMDSVTGMYSKLGQA